MKIYSNIFIALGVLMGLLFLLFYGLELHAEQMKALNELSQKETLLARVEVLCKGKTTEFEATSSYIRAKCL